jgi:hypothetical protein
MSGASSWVTYTLEIASASETCSWTGNWIPVLLSGGIWFQSTSSSVSIVFGLFGYSSSASVLTPGLIRLVTSNE